MWTTLNALDRDATGTLLLTLRGATGGAGSLLVALSRAALAKTMMNQTRDRTIWPKRGNQVSGRTLWTAFNALNRDAVGVHTLLIALWRASVASFTRFHPLERNFRPKRGDLLSGQGDWSTLSARDDWILTGERRHWLTLPRARFHTKAECCCRDVQVFGVRRAIGECCNELQARELPDARQHKEGEHRFAC